MIPMRTPAMNTPCKKCRKQGERAYPVVRIYCEHNQAGAVLDLRPELRMWSIYTPISREEFEEATSAAVNVIANNNGLAKPH